MEALFFHVKLGAVDTVEAELTKLEGPAGLQNRNRLALLRGVREPRC